MLIKQQLHVWTAKSAKYNTSGFSLMKDRKQGRKNKTVMAAGTAHGRATKTPGIAGVIARTP